MRLRGSGILGSAERRKLLRVAPLIVLAQLAIAQPALGNTVRFHGYRLTVPASWRVFDLARHPETCVRFNRHALYLGSPSSRQRCPAHAVGRTEAILLAPLGALRARAAGARQSSSGARPEVPAGPGSSFVLGSTGTVATVTWGRDRELLTRILHRRIVVASAAPSPALGASAASGPRPDAHAAQALYEGRGFDACSAPSRVAMSAWAASSYHAIGIYIGGINSACSQPNLNKAWVSAEVAAGWHLILTYVGYQGGGACAGTCATIAPGRASAEGGAAARDAIARAKALGIGAGNPIYDDMEQYAGGASNTTAVLAFLSAWTSALHAAGYRSGVYSSASSAISDLVRRSGSGYTEPDDIWFGDWNGRQTTADPYVPSSEWAEHQRLHQYAGDHDETYGGVTLDIDSDFLDGATAGTSPTIPDGTFIEVSNSLPVYEIAGGAPLYISSWTPFGGQQPNKSISPQAFDELPQYPADGTFLQTPDGTVYRIAGGAPVAGSWSVFGAPGVAPTIDPWDIANRSASRGRLAVVPSDGTVVEGLPSRRYWVFNRGLRTPTAASASATQVDDTGLTVFPVAPPGSTGTVQARAKSCVTPALQRLTLARARAALKRGDCRVGQLREPRHVRPHQVLKVFRQSAKPGTTHAAGYRVNVWLV